MCVLAAALASCGGGGDGSTRAAGAASESTSAGAGSSGTGTEAENGLERSAGSGGGNGSSTDGGPAGFGPLKASSLTRSEYIERAEEICREGAESLLEPILAYVQKHSKSGKDEEELIAEAVHKYLVPNYQIQIDELSQLGAPEGDAKQVEVFLLAMLRAVESLERRQKMSLEPDLEQAFGEAGDKALDYGILNCGN